MLKSPYLSVVILLLASTLASAQVLTGTTSSISPTGGANRGQTGMPYLATKVATSGQKLADGTIIAHTSTTKEARDSQGRTMTQHQLFAGIATAPKIMATSVYDPTNGTNIHWTDHEKVANVFHFPNRAESNARRVSPALGPAPAAEPPALVAGPVAGRTMDRTTDRTTNPAMRPKTQREKLGSRSLAGLYAEGERVTTTYPIDSVGNSRPIVVVTEIWRSPELKLVLLETTDDPRKGLSRMEITELDRSEPSPALFQPPSGYTVKEMTPQPIVP